ncbi:hypothetical protein [Prevotella sp. P6B1]|uniref:hypothetical protein n=1 Tax=Prevotella sp. P6B1 TaxID=1410613 RepID=UPI0018CC58D7|nr:hypothetical protein [Prevotella sp. P6B1]
MMNNNHNWWCLCAVLLLMAVGTAGAQSVKRPQLDQHHLLLDANLDQNENAAYCFRSFQEAVNHLGDSCILYVAPGVYWVDNPDDPEIKVGKDGREPFGCVVKCRQLRIVGLDTLAQNTVLAAQRGQTQGAVGNFTMLDIWSDSLVVENLTLGNYCNVDLDYPLNPALSRKKRSDAITQAHVGYVHGKWLTARNVRFISRLNLNPLNGADHSYYENCHFECTDDAMNGTAVYRHCTIDLYGQKPFWSTFGRGAMFVDCDFNVKGNNREMFFCKQGGPVTLIDCRYHAPSDSIYIGWTAYPQKWLRCYQKNFTLNGKPYIIGSRQQENTIVIDSLWLQPDEPPYLAINRHEAEMLVGGQPLKLHVRSDGRKVEWLIQPPYNQIATLDTSTGDSVTVSIACDFVDDPISFPVTAMTVDGEGMSAVAVCQVTVQPPLLPAPTFLKAPRISIKDGVARVGYQLNLQGREDVSRIVWGRLDSDDCQQEAVLADSNNGPQHTYKLRPSDVGRRLVVSIRPAHSRSVKGMLTQIVSRPITAKDIKAPYCLETDFSDVRCQSSQGLVPDAWQADGYKPADTAEYPWTFDPKKPMWAYGEGFNGAVGKGLLQAQRGARLMYTPAEGTYTDMTLTLQVDPTKTAGQGFGSATGQYMDVCLKFDTQTLTGYGLRIIRTTKHAKAVDFYLVKYQNGTVMPISDAISSTCYRTGCTISLTVKGDLLRAHVETVTPKPQDSTLPHVVDLSATIAPLPFGGIAIQHTGSCGESTTMLHHLMATW